MALVGLSSRGNIGPWGVWVGFGGGMASFLVAYFEDRAAKKKKRPQQQ
jgi:hypothetical protein